MIMEKQESKFKVGDLVRLKSGSPLMTVTEVIGSTVFIVFI